MFSNWAITMTNNKYLLFFSLLLLVSCVEPYWPELDRTDSSLVVDAVVTDKPHLNYVKLARSTPVNLQVPNPESDAEVVLVENNTTRILFPESESGTYIPDSFACVPGNTYRLEIRLRNGEAYASTDYLFKISEPFDTLYYDLERRPTTDPDFTPLVAQFYLNGFHGDGQGSHYLFRVTETYKYRADLVLMYIEQGNGLEEVTHPPPLICYKTTRIPGFYLYQVASSGTETGSPLPLHEVSFDDKRMLERYSLLIQQIRIDQEIFDILNQYRKQTEQKTLFDVQPYSIRGNIHSVDNPDEHVLGLFIVGDLQEKRRFFKPPAGVFFNLSECFVQTDGVGYLIMRGGSPTNPLYLTRVSGSIGAAAKQCFFCTEEGGVYEVPDFWRETQ